MTKLRARLLTGAYDESYVLEATGGNGNSDHEVEVSNRLNTFGLEKEINIWRRAVKIENQIVDLKKDIKEIVEDFLGMIKEKPELSSKNLNEDEKTKLMCLSGVKQYPMRVKCATLSWHTLTSAIVGNNEEINTEKLDQLWN